jgi:hypothetical protein
MGAVHRLVLRGQAPELAPFYRSVGGSEGPDGAWKAFRRVLAANTDELREEVKRPVQTNEVGRSGALIGGFLLVAERFGLPLRILELGASAGLNLRWDHFQYEARGERWGPVDSPVRLCDFDTPPVPPFEVDAMVAARRGCDRNPLDPTSPEDQITLLSFVWCDKHGECGDCGRLSTSRPGCRPPWTTRTSRIGSKGNSPPTRKAVPPSSSTR